MEFNTGLLFLGKLLTPHHILNLQDWILDCLSNVQQLVSEAFNIRIIKTADKLLPFQVVK